MTKAQTRIIEEVLPALNRLSLILQLLNNLSKGKSKIVLKGLDELQNLMEICWDMMPNDPKLRLRDQEEELTEMLKELGMNI